LQGSWQQVHRYSKASRVLPRAMFSFATGITADVSREAVSELRTNDETDSQVVTRAVLGFYAKKLLENAAAGKDNLKFSFAELKEVEVVVAQMSSAGFSSDKITACCRALFVDLSDVNLDNAFKFFEGEDGCAEKEELKKALFLMGQDIAQDKIDEFFAVVEKNNSGNIGSKEFKMLVRAVRGQEDLAFKFAALKMQVGSALPKAADKVESANEDTESKDTTQSPSLQEKMPAWVKSMEADRAAFGTAWSAGLKGLGPAQLTKVGKIIHNMKDAGYSDEKASTVCKAVFCKQSEDELKEAFDVFDDNKSGSVAGTEFGKILKLLGEDVPSDKVDDAFKQVDTNKSGKLEFSEFCAVVGCLNPNGVQTKSSAPLFPGWWTQAKEEAPKEEIAKDSMAEEKGAEVKNASWWSLGGSQGDTEGSNVSAVQQETNGNKEGSKESAAPLKPAWVTSVGADTAAFGTAWSAGLTGLGPAQMTKVGKIIHTMKDAGYSDEKAIAVCKALFCKQSPEELKQAFEVFDETKSGAVPGAEFGKLLKLLGEEVPAEKVDEAFKEVDTNKSGKLEYAEFCAVVQFLNPKSAPKEGMVPLFGTWWKQAQAETPTEAPKEASGEAEGKEAEATWFSLGWSAQSTSEADADGAKATVSKGD